MPVMTSHQNLYPSSSGPAHQEDSSSQSSAPPRWSRRNSSSEPVEDMLVAAREVEEGKKHVSSLRDLTTPMGRETLANASIPLISGVPMNGGMNGAVNGAMPLASRPSNFGIVIPGVYRSSYPKSEDFEFLSGLKLKTVVTLVQTDEPDRDLASFVSQHQINHVIYNMKGTKKESIPTAIMKSILDVTLDQRNYPLIMHCNHGKHRTGCVVAAMRKISGWEVQEAVDEYKAYADPKVRDCDVEYIFTLKPDDFQTAYPDTTLHEFSIELSRTPLSPAQSRAFRRLVVITFIAMTLWLGSGCSLRTHRNPLS